MAVSGCSIVLKDGELMGSSRLDLKTTMESVRNAGGNPTIAIHFHGGLVGQSDAEGAASKLAPEYASTGSVPIFVIWQTGLFETLQNNWKEIFKTEFFEGILERVLQFLVGRAEQPPGARGAPLDVPHPKEVRKEVAKRKTGEEPYQGLNPEPAKMAPDLTVAEDQQFKEAILKDASLAASAHAILKNADVRQFEPELQDAIRDSEKEMAAGGRGLITAFVLGVAVKAFMGALRRLNRGRGHGLYVTAVEEVAKAIFAADVFGRFAWNAMKQDTKDAFQDGDERFGGTALLYELEQIWAHGLRPRIVLVGHSAGAIFVCEMLKAAAKRLPADIKFEIILLAPACTFTLFDSMLTLAPDRIAAFRCFGMSDEFEQKDAMLGNLYPRSLLYLVSGALEEAADEPLLGMQRFHSRKSPFSDDEIPGIKRVIETIGSREHTWIWSMSSIGAGFDCGAASHGGFDFEPNTLSSVKHILQNGT
ncbi:hypothetical protein [Bradyrhizobium cytisi]|uniref:Alpha/beta hydrolase n=1 Tax=Bradyrhizobium cytisi TaxID=515489 RepID=A0A5S4W0K0_9BRAD|nr:hypothetical protein [Bradyrhizobium cytisi]TYL71654.1 hypothetical protein FXB38_39860 [Bradyrhizobium cytisi]